MQRLIDLYDLEAAAEDTRKELRHRNACSEEWILAERKIERDIRLLTERALVEPVRTKRCTGYAYAGAGGAVIIEEPDEIC